MNIKIRLVLLVALTVLAGCSVEQPPVTPTTADAPAALPDQVQYSVRTRDRGSGPHVRAHPELSDSARVHQRRDAGTPSGSAAS